MKDIYKDPIVYYIVIPLVIALWPLLVWSVYLPRAKRNLNDEINDYKKSRALMLEILSLDPDRLELVDSKNEAEEFDYARAVERVATLCRIPSTQYKLSSGIRIKSGEQVSQNANVILKDVSITKIARFLSTIQLRWPDLQCVQIKKLKKKPGLPDTWDADLEFKYYY